MSWYKKLFPSEPERKIVNSYDENFDVADKNGVIEVGSYNDKKFITVENREKLIELHDVLGDCLGVKS